MIAGILRGMQAALQVRQRSVQDRGTMFRAIKAGSGLLLGLAMVWTWISVVLGNGALVLGQNIHPETLPGMQMSVSPRAMIDTDQHQQWIKRHRGEGVGGHPLYCAFVVDTDDRNPGSKAAHGLAEFRLSNAHGKLESPLAIEFLRVPYVPRSVPFKFYHGSHVHDAFLLNSISFEANLMYDFVSVSVGQTAWTERRRLNSYTDELRSGVSLSRESACQRIRCTDQELAALLSAAMEARQRFKPGVVTYSRKVFIPLTNLCRDYCGYCTFRRDPGQTGAHTMTPDEVLAVVRAGERMGCTEALFSLGDKPELAFPEMRETLRGLGYKSTLHYLEAMCELVLRETSLLPHPNPGLLSAEWIARLARVSPSMGLMLETTNASLLAPGAAHDNAPDKVPVKRLRTIEEAGKQNVPFTTGLLIGIGETPEDRVDTLLAIRELHRRYGHIQEVIIQNFRAKPEIPMRHWPEPSQGEMMRTIAVARLLMPDVNIQAPPNLSAPYYDELLDAGINDWGGISPLTPDFINPERPWPHLEQLRLRTQAKGYALRQRLPVYAEFVPAVTSGPGLLSEKVKAAVDSEGYARRPA